MKKIIGSINRLMAIMMLAGVLFSPMMISEAMALAACPPHPPLTCIGAPCNSCPPGSKGGTGQCSLGGGFTAYVCVSTPEMSDYLAMAFVVMAGGMIYYLRRRAVA